MKIFVGHSFEERDKALVNTIISFLAKQGISCETGEKAQNKSVSGKVKSRIDNNEVFLGVFTVDQQINQSGKATRSFMSRFILAEKFIVQDFPIFTTSNWVLQESGYAIAKDKKIILMVENGIYKFPELQGDAEVIPFDRDSLDKPFLKLAEMLWGNIQSGSTGVQVGSSPTESQEDFEKKEVDSGPAFTEMFDAHEEKDIKKAEEIYRKSVRPKLESTEQKIWDAVLLRWQYSAGEANKFFELEKMYNDTKEYGIGVQLGICYESFDKYKDARDVYQRCFKDVASSSDKFNCCLRIANCYLKEKDHPAAINTLLEAANNPEFFQKRGRAFGDLVKIAEEKEDDYLYFVFAEKALDVNPVDNSLRFKVAYKYSQKDRRDLALYHYKKLLESADNVTALNNIGVAYSNLDMLSKGVKFYEKASARKNTLANANLAYKYLNEGFTDLAEKLLKKSDELSGEGVEVHENIGYAKKALKDKLEAEDKKEDEVMAQVAKGQKFRINHSDGFCQALQSPCDISGKWILGEWGETDVQFNKQSKTFVAKSSKNFTVNASPFSSALLGSPAPTVKTRIIELSGSIYNSAGVYTLRVTEGKEASTILSSVYDEVYSASGLLIVNEGNNSIDVMEENKNNERKYNQWKRV